MQKLGVGSMWRRGFAWQTLLHICTDIVHCCTMQLMSGWLNGWRVGGWVGRLVGWLYYSEMAIWMVSVGGWKHPVVHWKPLPIRNFVMKLHVGAAGLVVLPSSKCICIYLHRFHQLSLAFLCGFLFGIFCCSSGPNEPGQWIRAYDCCSG